MVIHPKALSAISAGRGERHQKDDSKKTRLRTVPYTRINKLQSNPLKADQGVWYISENFGFLFFLISFSGGGVTGFQKNFLILLKIFTKVLKSV